VTLLRTLIVLALALLALPVAAQDLPPRPDGPVYDGANMIDPATEAQLNEELRAYNEATGRAVIVATVPDLGGNTIEGYAVDLFETWGIGGEETDEGALLLVARDDRKIRIEVGYGSTPTLTDATSGRIIRDTITPAFKQEEFSAGIAAGVAQMIEALDMDPATALARGLARRSGEDRFEDMGLPFQETLRHGFLALAHAHADRCVVIAGNRDTAEVASEVAAHALSRLAGSAA